MGKGKERKILKIISRGLHQAIKEKTIPNVNLLEGLNKLGAYIFLKYGLSESNIPGNYYDLISLCYKPFSEWEMITNKSYQKNRLLLPDGNLSDFALELIHEKDNDLIIEVMKKLRSDKKGQEKYIFIRKFLIDNPSIKTKEFQKRKYKSQFPEIFKELAQFYEKPPINCEKKGYYHICNNCNWIINFNKFGDSSCTSEKCKNNGSSKISAMDSYLRVKRDVANFISNPGRSELDILMKINEFDVKTKLWPFFDLYDIEIKFKNNKKWSIDIKDFIDPIFLSEKINEGIPEDKKWERGFFVIPNHRANKSYMRILRNSWKATQNNVEILSQKKFLKRLELELSERH